MKSKYFHALPSILFLTFISGSILNRPTRLELNKNNSSNINSVISNSQAGDVVKVTPRYVEIQGRIVVVSNDTEVDSQAPDNSSSDPATRTTSTTFSTSSAPDITIQSTSDPSNQDNGNSTTPESSSHAKHDTTAKLDQIYQKIKVAKKSFWLTFIAVWSIITTVSTILYLKLTAHTQESRFKSRTVCVIAIISGYIFSMHAMATEAFNPYYPCVLRIFIGYPTLFVFCISLNVRAVLYTCQVRLIVLKNEISSLLTNDDRDNNRSLVFENSQSRSSFTKLNSFSRFFRLITNRKYSNNPQDRLAEVQYRISANNAVLDLLRDRNYLILVFAALVVGFSIAIYFSTYSLYHFSPVSYGCPSKITTPLVPLYAVVFFCISLVPPIYFLSTGMTDAYGIQAELFVTMVSSILLVIGLVVYNEFISVFKVIYASGYVIVLPLFFIQHYMLIILPLIKIYRLRPHRTHERSSNGNGRVTTTPGYALAISTKKEQFESILAYPAGFVRLSKAAAETFCPENVNFLRDYQVLKFKVCSLITSDSMENENLNGEKGFFSSGISRDYQPTKQAMIESDKSSVGPDTDNFSSSKIVSKKSILMDINAFSQYSPKNSMNSSNRLKDASLYDEVAQDEIDFEQLLSGEIMPPLPVTIADSIYRMGLMLDLQLLNNSEGKKDRNLPKHTQIPYKLVSEFYKFYLKYIQKDALLAVNITTKAMAPIENSIRKQKYTLGMFDDALEEVLNNLYTNTYPIMLKTL
ncbi:hypothetical protein AYI69_g496 [Smittium culicis]|uniref:RGS domain-containing protein n=1 Tax=Smittium culicis TaxID=133412 RepID=A0A1R1YSV9_9FUNG|nr:hypothetical protein AYI69_g496 [Smittium culicis]